MLLAHLLSIFYISSWFFIIVAVFLFFISFNFHFDENKYYYALYNVNNVNMSILYAWNYIRTSFIFEVQLSQLLIACENDTIRGVKIECLLYKMCKNFICYFCKLREYNVVNKENSAFILTENF